jgi:ribosome biogenesis SPOUT family RNA methylase Rps3
MSGELSILTEDGVVRYKGPYQGITRPGTKRIIFTHTDCVFITVHATDKLTPEEAEEDVIAKTFDDPEISLEDMRRLLE